MAKNKRTKKKSKNTRTNHLENALVPVNTAWTADSLRTQPLRAGEVLRALHAQEDYDKLCDFFCSFDELHDDDFTEELFDALFEGGMVQALMDIALERRVYALAEQDEDHGVSCIFYVSALCKCC